MEISYVLPILRRAGEDGLDELTDYLVWLSERVEVVVADGSAPEVFAVHRQHWGPRVVHLPVENGPHRYGKVTGVHLGVAAASYEAVILADDDVRYTDDGLCEMGKALVTADLVRPQNYFSPLPWHAAWDTARTLLNRAFDADSPGTLGVRRSFFMTMNGYSDEAMYENLELIRTVAAHGGRITERPDLYVRRLPGTARRFFEQRPRQAYDDFAQPIKLGGFLAAAPAMAWMFRRTTVGHRVVPLAALCSVMVAESGRRRHGGSQFFSAITPWFAPLWLVERSVGVWLAVLYRLTGGVPYAGTRFRVAAHSAQDLRRRAGSYPVAAVAHGRVAGAAAPAESYHRTP